MKKHLSKIIAPITALMLMGGLAIDSDVSAQSSRSKSSSQKRSSSKSSKSKSKAKSGSSSSRSRSSSSKSKSSASGHRLPAYYAQVGLKDEQRDEIYEIQDKFKSEIQALEKKLADLREKMNDDIEDVLTRTQKTKLNALKRAASSGSKSSSTKSSSSKKSSSSRSSSKKK